MPRHLPLRRLIAVLAASALLAGCSGTDEPKGSSSTGPGGGSTPTAAESNYLDVPDGVELTAPGSEISLGDTATVAYQPRQDTVGALAIKVVRLREASFDQFVGWKLTSQIKSTTPYFVDAKVTNVGDSDLGGRTVPLYIVDGKDRLIEPSVFTAAFHPCEGATFPKKFEQGDSTRACMVYLSPDHGDLTAVSFRPTQDFDPITWTGEVQKAAAPGKKKHNKDGQGKKGKKKGKKG